MIRKCFTASAILLTVVPAWAQEQVSDTKSMAVPPLAQEVTPAKEPLVAKPPKARDVTQVEASSRALYEASATAQSPQEGDIIVQGYRTERLSGTAAAGVLGNRPVLNIPYSVSTFSSADIENRMVISLSELLKDDPSITPTYAGNSFQDGFVIRGFDAGVTTLGYYGLFGLVFARQPFENLERIEVFKGPTATINGRSGNVGGTINLVPKTPASTPVTHVTAQYISDSNLEVRGDVSRRFGSGDSFGVRVSGAVRGGDTAIDYVKSRVRTGAISFEYRQPTFVVNVIGDYSSGRYGAFNERISLLPTLPYVPRAPDLTNLVTQPWTYRTVEQARIVGRAQWTPSEVVTISAAYGHDNTTAFTLSSGGPRIINLAGDTTASSSVSDLAHRADTVDLTGRLRLDTGPLRHRLFISGTYIAELQDNASTSLAATASNIYNPVYVARPSFTIAEPKRLYEEKTKAITIGDELSILDEKVTLIGAVRVLNYRRQGFNQTTGLKNAPLIDEDATLPTVALLLKPIPALTLYANYIEAFENGGVAPQTAANAFEVLSPTISNQYEIGAKYGSRRLGATIAVFRIRRQSTFTNPTTNIFAAAGNQVHKGIELTVNGEPVTGVRLAAGATFIDPKVRNSPTPAFNGNDPVGVAHFQGSASGEIDVPFAPGLSLNASVFSAGRQYADQANLQRLPRYTRVDVGGRFATEISGKAVTFRATVNNVAGTDYYQGAGGGFIILGVPRTFLASASIDF